MNARELLDKATSLKLPKANKLVRQVTSLELPRSTPDFLLNVLQIMGVFGAVLGSAFLATKLGNMKRKRV